MALRPAVVAQLVVDNTKGTKPKTGVFALNHSRTGPHMISDDLGRKTRAGFAFRREAGVAAEVFDVTSKKKAAGPAAVRLHALVGRPTASASATTPCTFWGRARASASRCRPASATRWCSRSAPISRRR